MKWERNNITGNWKLVGSGRWLIHKVKRVFYLTDIEREVQVHHGTLKECQEYVRYLSRPALTGTKWMYLHEFRKLMTA